MGGEFESVGIDEDHSQQPLLRDHGAEKMRIKRIKLFYSKEQIIPLGGFD